jgi:hypothetical protein
MSAMLEAILGYRQLLADPPGEPVVRLQALARTLDALAMAVHQTQASDDDGDHVPSPSGRYNALRRAISPRFPELGLYATIVPGPPTDLQGVVGDAIDDLVDIALDLEAVLWRVEHVNLQDAMWHFRFGFISHWGQHLLELRGHVHHLLRQELV